MVCTDQRPCLERSHENHARPWKPSREQPYSHYRLAPDHHLEASLVQGTNQAFSAAVLDAYRSLDGNPQLQFPRGIQRKLVDYETVHIQDIAATTSAFDAQSIHGDWEILK